jgi:hypothetical protein
MKKAVAIVALILVSAVAWYVFRNPGSPALTPAKQEARQNSPPPSAGARTPSDPRPKPRAAKIVKRARVSRAVRDDVHKRILDALSRRGGGGGDGDQVDEDDPDEAKRGPKEGELAWLRNRLGGEESWNDVVKDLLENDFTPLADECFEAARERNPSHDRDDAQHHLPPAQRQWSP